MRRKTPGSFSGFYNTHRSNSIDARRINARLKMPSFRTLLKMEGQKTDSRLFCTSEKGLARIQARSAQRWIGVVVANCFLIAVWIWYPAGKQKHPDDDCRSRSHGRKSRICATIV